MRGTSAEAEQRPAQSERLSQLSESLPEWRIRRSGGGAERFVVPFVTLAAKPDDMTRRGWSSFADTRQITFLKTIGEDQRIRHFLAAVCRRRWPSGRRTPASQRVSVLRKVICNAIIRREPRSVSVKAVLFELAEQVGLGGICRLVNGNRI